MLCVYWNIKIRMICFVCTVLLPRGLKDSQFINGELVVTLKNLILKECLASDYSHFHEMLPCTHKWIQAISCQLAF